MTSVWREMLARCLKLWRSLSQQRRTRIVHVTRSFQEAEAWDIEQQVRMTPTERMRAARALKDRCYPHDAPDVRASGFARRSQRAPRPERS